MSRLGEEILYQIASRRYQARQARQDQEERGSSPEKYWRWQWDSSPRLFAHYPDLDLVGKEVLDIGCGIGGRTCYLAGQGPKRIVGCDINTEEIATAAELRDRLAPQLADRIEFSSNRAGSTDFEHGQFDVVLIVDAMEHMESPEAMLAEAFRVVKPGGKLYFSTFGWWHWAASHMMGIIPVPFVQVLFSDQTILNTTRRLMSQDYYRPSQWDSDPPTLRWEGITSLKDRPGEHLNKYSIRQFEKALAQSPFSDTRVHVVGFSPRRKLMRPFNFLSQVPLIRELWHSYLVGIARRRTAGGVGQGEAR